MGWLQALGALGSGTAAGIDRYQALRQLGVENEMKRKQQELEQQRFVSEQQTADLQRQQIQAALLKMGIEDFTTLHGPGDTLSTDDQAKAHKLGLDSLLQGSRTVNPATSAPAPAGNVAGPAGIDLNAIFSRPPAGPLDVPTGPSQDGDAPPAAASAPVKPLDLSQIVPGVQLGPQGDAITKFLGTDPQRQSQIKEGYDRLLAESLLQERKTNTAAADATMRFNQQINPLQLQGLQTSNQAGALNVAEAGKKQAEEAAVRDIISKNPKMPAQDQARLYAAHGLQAPNGISELLNYEVGMTNAQNRLAMNPNGPTGFRSLAREDARKSAMDIAAGKSSPLSLEGRDTGNSLAVKGYLHDLGIDSSTLILKYKATQAALKSLNSAPQVRYRQAIDKANASLGLIEQLTDGLDRKLDKYGSPAINKGLLALAKQGAYGTEAQDAAFLLEQQIADVTGELGQVIMGGNAPTDKGLDLAAKNFQAEWTSETLHKTVAQARKNLDLASQAVSSTKVIGGGSTGNDYASKMGLGTYGSTSAVATPTGSNQVRYELDKNGNLVPVVKK